MTDFKLKIDKRKFGDLFLRSDEVRRLVAQETERAAERVRSVTDDEIVTQAERGKVRARGYVTRLGSGLTGEARDGALTKGLG